MQTKFDGSDYNPGRDDGRLTAQYDRIFNVMNDGVARTLSQIAKRTGDPEASISAQLRHMRKARHGGHTVEKQHIGEGLFAYRLVVASRELEPV